MLQQLENRAQALMRFPQRRRAVPGLRQGGIASHLEIIEAAWRLLYTIAGLEVHIVAVLDGRRQLHDLLLDRFLRQ